MLLHLVNYVYNPCGLSLFMSPGMWWCVLTSNSQDFEGPYCLHLQGQAVHEHPRRCESATPLQESLHGKYDGMLISPYLCKKDIELQFDTDTLFNILRPEFSSLLTLLLQLLETIHIERWRLASKPVVCSRRGILIVTKISWLHVFFKVGEQGARSDEYTGCFSRSANLSCVMAAGCGQALFWRNNTSFDSFSTVWRPVPASLWQGKGVVAGCDCCTLFKVINQQ